MAEGPLNHLEEYEEYLAGLPRRRSRRLTFAEKCGLAWALKEGERTETVASAFDLSHAAISMLRHCLQPNPKHYVEVWEKYRDLGPEEFKIKYFPHELWARLLRVRDNMAHLDETKTDRARHVWGPDPHAKKYVGPVEINGIVWRIIWADDVSPAGWYVERDPVPNQFHFFGKERIYGRDDLEPFRTSAEAFDGLYQVVGERNPRPKPGRPRK